MVNIKRHIGVNLCFKLPSDVLVEVRNLRPALGLVYYQLYPQVGIMKRNLVEYKPGDKVIYPRSVLNQTFVNPSFIQCQAENGEIYILDLLKEIALYFRSCICAF